MAEQERSQGTRWIDSRTGLVLLGFLVMAVFYLLSEHPAHVFGVMPWLLFALCPLMHLFMHGGHKSELDRREKR